MGKESKNQFTDSIFIFLKPSKFIAIILPAIILSLLIIFSFAILLYNSVDNTRYNLVYIQEEVYFIISDYIEFDLILSTIWSGMTWLVVGAILYIVGWLIIVAAVDSYNDIIVSEYFVHPDSFHKSDYWSVILGKYVLRASALVLLVALVYLLLVYAIPFSISVIQEVFGNGKFDFSPSLIIVIFLVFSLPYLFLIFSRLLFLKRDLFS